MRAITLLCAAAVLVPLLLCGLAQQRRIQTIDEWEALEMSLRSAKSIVPKDGFIPDEATAVKVGEAVALAQYGEKKIAGERPFRGMLKGDTWTVKGTVHPQGALGGHGRDQDQQSRWKSVCSSLIKSRVADVMFTGKERDAETGLDSTSALGM